MTGRMERLSPEHRARLAQPYEEHRKTLTGDALLFEPETGEVTLRFESRAAASGFLHWLSRIGEQDYWEWMRLREEENPEPKLTGLRFRYHRPGRGIVAVECGRMDDGPRDADEE